MVHDVVAEGKAARDDTYGQITDDGVARLRSRIGIPVRNPTAPHYREHGEIPVWARYSAEIRQGTVVVRKNLDGSITEHHEARNDW